MKFKYLLLLLLPAVILFFVFIPQKTLLSPQTNAVQLNSHITYFLAKEGLGTNQAYRSFPLQNVVFFKLEYENNSIDVWFSYTKDPYYQVISLQQILTTAKMESKMPKVIDLSGTNPYVSF